MANVLLSVKIKTDQEIKRLRRIQRRILRLDPMEDIARFGLKKVIKYSPSSIKDGWGYKITGNTINFVHERVPEKVLWFLELGTVAHYIQPVTKKVLHWVDEGGSHFSKGHMVSGIQPHLFFTKAKADMETFAKQKYGKHVKITL